MPRVTLSPYEYNHDLMPSICAKCAAPATDRVPRRMRFAPEQLVWLWGIPVLATLVLCPPLFLGIVVLIGERVEVRIPTCSEHANDWVWRDRISYALVLPIWSLIAMALTASIALDSELTILYLALAVLTTAAAIAFDYLVTNRGAVVLIGGEGRDIQLRGVHPEFAAALEVLRERHRVENPVRYGRFGDLRDDFDDDPPDPPPMRGPPGRERGDLSSDRHGE